MEEIVNKVAASGIITINLEEMIPQEDYREIDMKGFLWQEFALREKDFRDTIKQTDWSTYKNAVVGLYCSNDAIVPTWAWMLLTDALQPFAKNVSMGTLAQIKAMHLLQFLNTMELSQYVGARIVVKGCSKAEIPMQAYVVLAQRLKPIVRSVLYGEPCSTVPIFKNKAQ